MPNLVMYSNNGLLAFINILPNEIIANIEVIPIPSTNIQDKSHRNSIRMETFQSKRYHGSIVLQPYHIRWQNY